MKQKNLSKGAAIAPSPEELGFLAVNWMKKNIGKKDRLFRLLIAIALLGYAYVQQSPWALLGSLFVFFEAAMSWCVFYQLIGKNSCPLDKK